LSLFAWAPFRATKAALKLHTLLDLRGAIPAFIHISDGKLHDVNILDMLGFEASAFYLMDRGYMDFGRLYTLHQTGAFFVTRAKSTMDARRVYATCTERHTGVICDQRVMRNSHYSANKYPEHLRRIRFKDPDSVKTHIWCAVATYVLIAIVKKQLHLDASLYTFLQILSVSVFEKTEISCPLRDEQSETNQEASHNQLNLFEI